MLSLDALISGLTAGLYHTKARPAAREILPDVKPDQRKSNTNQSQARQPEALSREWRCR